MKLRLLPLSFVALLSVTTLALAQDRLKTMPGYERYTELGRKAGSAWRSGSLPVEWDESGKALQFRRDNKTWRYELGAADVIEAPKAEAGQKPPSGRRQAGGPERGRQFSSAPSPDGKLEAFHKDRNLWLRDADGKNERQITTEGDAQKRTKNAVASWVYGEELDQNTAMWWSPDGSKLALLPLRREWRARLLPAARPDAVAEHDRRRGLPEGRCAQSERRDPRARPRERQDRAARRARRQAVRGRDVGHYVYGVRGRRTRELLFHRTNRNQNVMEYCAADPASGKCRVIVREEWPDELDREHARSARGSGRPRFVWASRSARASATSTSTTCPASCWRPSRASVRGRRASCASTRTNQRLFYTARSGDNHMKLQLHRVGLDGKGDTRLTDPALHHDVDVAPDGGTSSTSRRRTTSRRRRGCGCDGKRLRELAASDTKEFDALGLKRVESFTFKAGDGTTDLHGLLHFPSNFDPAKKYPLLVSVYARSRDQRRARDVHAAQRPDRIRLPVRDARLAQRRRPRQALPRRDLPEARHGRDRRPGGGREGAREAALRQRLERVGIFGTSYGGYVSAMRCCATPRRSTRPVACSPVTDWRHYDTIYTERYMRTPQDNAAGYDAGSAMAGSRANLKGRLMLFYGTADNNVHPNNTMQLVAGLQRNGKSFELQVGPDGPRRDQHRAHDGVLHREPGAAMRAMLALVVVASLAAAQEAPRAIVAPAEGKFERDLLAAASAAGVTKADGGLERLLQYLAGIVQAAPGHDLSPLVEAALKRPLSLDAVDAALAERVRAAAAAPDAGAWAALAQFAVEGQSTPGGNVAALPRDEVLRWRDVAVAIVRQHRDSVTLTGNNLARELEFLRARPRAGLARAHRLRHTARARARSGT
jgi:dipeptidyl-peptidase-4